METKEIKQRLDDLDELQESGYITENEFRIARVNTLKDCGVDVTIHSRRHEGERPRREPKSSSGCGCFLIVLILLGVVGSGVYFGASSWPENLAGAYVRQVGEWTIALREMVIPSREDLQHVPPVSSDDLEMEPADSQAPLSPDVFPRPEIPNDVSSAGSTEEAAESYESSDHFADSAPSPDGIPLPDAGVFDIVIPGMELDEEEDVIVFTPTPDPVDPEPIYEQLPWAFVSAPRARIRTVPDTTTNANMVGWARNGDRFRILNEGRGRDGLIWYNVVFEDNERRGWISSTLVRLE